MSNEASDSTTALGMDNDTVILTTAIPSSLQLPQMNQVVGDYRYTGVGGVGGVGDDDESTMSKKRSRDEAAAKEAEDKKNRGNYRCSKCNLPKKGHVCPYQPRFKKRDQMAETSTDVEIQCEIDPDMTVRNLDISKQGYPESYMVKANNKINTQNNETHDNTVSDTQH